MLKLNTSGKFKKDLKMCSKRGYNLKLLEDIVNTLRIPEKNKGKEKHMKRGILITAIATVCSILGGYSQIFANAQENVDGTEELLPWAETDSNQLLHTELIYDSSGSPYITSVYCYDTEGRPCMNMKLTDNMNPQYAALEYIEYNGNEKTVYQYNYLPNVLRKQEFVAPGYLKQTDEFYFENWIDSSGDDVSWTLQPQSSVSWTIEPNSSKSVSDIGYYLYNEDGICTEYDVSYGNDSSTHQTSSYDETGKLIERCIEWYTSGELNKKSHTQFFYTATDESEERVLTRDTDTGTEQESILSYFSIAGSWEDILQMFGDFPGTYISEDGKSFFIATVGELFLKGFRDETSDVLIPCEYGIYELESQTEGWADLVYRFDPSDTYEKDESIDIVIDGDTLYYGDEVFHRH